MEVEEAKAEIRTWLKRCAKMTARDRNAQADAIDIALSEATDGESLRDQFRFLRENMARGLSPDEVSSLGLGVHFLVNPQRV